MKFITLKDKMTVEDLEIFYDEFSCSKIPRLDILQHQPKLNWIFERAVKNGDIDVIRELLQSGVKVSQLNDSNQTALHLACRLENFKAIELIFPYCNNCVNFVDSSGLSHFHVACVSGNLKIAERFLNLGVDVNLRDGSNGYTALYYATKYNEFEIVEMLLRYGADPNAKDLFEQTPLHLNCGLPNMVKKLKFLRDEGMNCEDLLARLMNLDVTKLLVDYVADVNVVDGKSNTPLFYASKENFPEELVSVISHGEGKKKVLDEIKKMQKLKIEHLLANNANVGAVNFVGDTVLHLVVSRTHDFEIVRLLLQNKADPNARNNNDETPLKIAASLMDFNLVQILLEFGADAKDLDLQYFHHDGDFLPDLQIVQNLLRIVNLLAEHGMHVSQRDNLAILKFFVAGNSNCQYANPQDKNTRAKLKNLFELGTDSNIKTAMSKFPLNISDCSYEDQMTKKLMIYEIRKHLDLIKHSEIFINEGVVECLEAKALLLEKSLLPIYSCSSFDKNLCRYDLDQVKDEVDRMKNTMLSKHASLHEILMLNPDKICVNNFYYENVLKCENFKKDFVISGGIIRGHFTKSLIRRYVIESAKEHFGSLINFSLPDLCCEAIFKYLSNESLYDLCVASVKL